MVKVKIPPAPMPDFAPIPEWLRSALRGDQADFAAGAALALLHPLAKNEAPPAILWRLRAALAAASQLTGVDQAQLRDHWQLRRASDDPGPAGRVYGALRRMAQPKVLSRVNEAMQAFDIALTPDIEKIVKQAQEPQSNPISAAAKASALILAHDQRAQGFALWVADAVLARGLGWDLALPLLSCQIKRSDLKSALQGPEIWHKIVASAYAKAAIEAYGSYAELARRVHKLQGVAHKLRGKDAHEALETLMRQEAVAAQAGSLTSDRAARRLFDRLVELQAVRELTGRSSFRLYGI